MPTGMSFFECQEQARKKTGRLVILFGVAVAAIILTTYLAVAFFYVTLADNYPSHRGRNSRHRYSAEYKPMAERPSMWEPPLLACVGTGVLAVVGVGTLVKLGQLRSGGRAVAESVGGRAINANIAGPQERKIINVVEEMAIASGIPVPPVYILDEDSLNAFAAGYTPRDAVVTVTRGSVELLTRDELQGVVGHEFSHILNGDMRLNIQLMGVLHGILAIGLIGWFIMRLAFNSGGRSSRRSKDGGGTLLILALGGTLMVIGYVGTFFGNLIKAAVSRQREFLADASSVQFTRNPLGIAGALKKIGGLAGGSRIEHHAAAQVSHMFFGQASASWLDFLLATHPPLTERIRRVDPAWDGKFTTVAPLDSEPATPKTAPAAEPVLAGLAAVAASAAMMRAVDKVGRPSQVQLAQAASLIEQLPDSVKAAAHEPFAARALVYAMLIDKDQETQGRQLDHLRRHAEPGTAAECERLLPEVQALDDRQRLPALDLAMPALRQLSQPQYATFRDSVERLIRTDDKVELFEWMVQQLVLRNLAPQFNQAGPPRVQYYGLGRLTRECSLLLSTLAYIGQRDATAAGAAFDAGAQCLGEIAFPLQIVEAAACKFGTLEVALDQLDQTAPRLKRQIVEACSATVLADGRVTTREAELLRGILAILGCPVPPLAGASDEGPMA